MKKAENIDIAPPEKVTIIRGGSFSVKPVIKVDITNIDDIHIIYDKGKTVISKDVKTCCHKDMADKKLMAKILKMEAQLWHEEAAVGRFDSDPDKKLEAIGLRIAIAQKAKELAQIYVSLYKSEEYKQKILSIIYAEYVIFNYEMATNAIKLLLKSGELDDKPEEKERLGNWLLYIHGSLLAACILNKDPRWIDRGKKEGREIDELLISKDLGHLVTTREKYSGEEVKHDAYLPHFTSALKSAISSLFSNLDSQQEVKPTPPSASALSQVKKGHHTE